LHVDFGNDVESGHGATLASGVARVPGAISSGAWVGARVAKGSRL
jgi:hypothetical protein